MKLENENSKHTPAASKVVIEDKRVLINDTEIYGVTAFNIAHRLYGSKGKRKMTLTLNVNDLMIVDATKIGIFWENDLAE